MRLKVTQSSGPPEPLSSPLPSRKKKQPSALEVSQQTVTSPPASGITSGSMVRLSMRGKGATTTDFVVEPCAPLQLSVRSRGTVRASPGSGGLALPLAGSPSTVTR